MANIYYLKPREGCYFDEQKQILLDFLDKSDYKNICFLIDTLNKIEDRTLLGKALRGHWGEKNFNHFVKQRAISFDDGQIYSYGTVKTLGSRLSDFDLIVHVYAYIDSFLRSSRKIFPLKDQVLVYWINDEELDQWVSILEGENIGPGEQIPPISLDLSNELLDPLKTLNTVNVTDGATHSLDEKKIKEVAQKTSIGANTLKAYIVRELHFRPHHAENTVNKVSKWLS